MTSATHIDREHHSRPSPIESFPFEIKVMILRRMPGLSCLRNIVHASPAYHEAYLGAREEVLHVITTHILHQNGISLLDPRTAVRAPQLGYDIDNRAEIITEFLERYQGRMDGNPRRLALQDSLAILNLQSKIAILISEYCKAVFATNPLTESKVKDSLPPSQSELNRLYRAYWRYVIYSRLFAPINGDRHRVIDFDASVFDEIVMAHKFLGLFPIHEVEELACLHKDAEILYRMQSEGEKQDEVVDQGPKQLYKALTAKSKQERDARIDESGTYEILYIKMRTALKAYNNNVSWVSWQWKGMDDKFASDRVPTLVGYGQVVMVYRKLTTGSEDGAMCFGIGRGWTIGISRRRTWFILRVGGLLLFEVSEVQLKVHPSLDSTALIIARLNELSEVP